MVQMIVFVSSVPQIDQVKCNNVELGLVLGFLAPFHNVWGSEWKPLVKTSMVHGLFTIVYLHLVYSYGI